MKKFLRYLLPVPLKKCLKYVYYGTLDVADRITGKVDPNYPPRRLNFVGSHDFRKVGEEFLEHFIALGKLKPTDQVLDIGSGIGRMAIPLTKYINKNGCYEGFDIDARGVAWCQKNITPAHQNFNFQYTDIYNLYYNKNGETLAKNFEFPYPNNSFDFVFATSVFTHLLHEDGEQYLKEIHRVLKPEGRSFITWFTLDPKTERLMKNGKSAANFKYESIDCSACFYSHPHNPEAETAYQMAWVKEQYKTHKIDKHFKIHPGWWRGEKGVSYQDIVVSKKG